MTATAGPPLTSSLETTRRAAWALFALNGLLFATWAVLIPAFQERLHLDAGGLSVQLFMIMIGNLLILPVARSSLQTRGLKTTAAWSVLLTVAGLIGTALSGTPLPAALSLLAYGLGFGALDFTLNAAGTWVEERLERPVMSGLHAAFSTGTLIGAALGSILIHQGLTLPAQMGGLSLLGLGLGLLAVTRLTAFQSESGTPGEKTSVPRGLVLLLLAGFAAALVEGVINDWSAVYLRGLGVTLSQAAWGYMAFTATMVVGRLAGDHLTRRLGRQTLSVTAATLCLLGLLLVNLGPSNLFKVTGFALSGLGLSVLAPLAFSAAWGQVQSRGIALMTAIFYGGFLLGPPLTGQITQHFTGSSTFILPALLMGMTVLLSVQRVFNTPESA